MNLIVFDLEWNMGNAPKTFNYHGAELTLRGEIIQIGAVRVDENGDVLDTFEMTLRPRIFRKLHWRIAEVTGLSQGDLEAGVPIAEGLRRFQEWAGPDAEFAEWGLDDVPVLKQNLFLYNMDESWPTRWYDLQQIFLKNFPRGEGEGLTLESVVDRLGIEHDGDFHNALDDALYTTKICRRLPLAQGIAEYPDPAAQLTAALLNNTDTETYDIQTYFDRLDHDAYKNDPALYQVGCPFCGKPLVLNDIWLKRGNTGYYTEATCPDHGPWFLRFKLNRRDGLHWNFARCIETVRPESYARYKKLEKCLKSIRKKTDFKPEKAVILGSGLGDYAEKIQIEKIVKYTDIEDFPVSTVQGHKGQFVFGYVKGVPVVLMQGRVHYYEGYSMQDVVLPTRLMGMMGAKKILLTNAAGGVNPSFRPGDFMMITDHITTAVPSPLIGPNIEELGTRFPDMSEVYSKNLQKIIRKSAKDCGIPLQEGVYVQLTGPNYETPAEIRMVRSWGADAVGMSTACEAMAARHMGMEVCGISCITNMAAGVSDAKLNHAEVQETADKVAEDFEKLVTDVIVGI